jgi:hypothetical protein
LGFDGCSLLITLMFSAATVLAEDELLFSTEGGEDVEAGSIM